MAVTPYISLTEATDRVSVSPEWFLANVAPELPRPIALNGETCWLRSGVDDWKARCDAARDGALDELAALDQGPHFDGFFYRTNNASTLV